MEALINKTREMTTEQILEAANIIGGDFRIDEDSRMVRAALIEVYGDREGEEAADNLMDFLGM